MERRIAGRVGLIFLAIVMLLPGVTLAQTGTIGGSVRDTTGAVLPGVTIEAASPALIEKVRTVVTDSQGEYKIVDLRPGVYAVTFTLPGFSTVRREGVEVASGFVANVSAELRVGSLEETITVSGQSPLVDVQNVTQQRAFTPTQIDALPTGRVWFNYVGLIAAVGRNPRGQDVGGNTGDNSQTMSIHGSVGGELRWNLDGMRLGNMNGTGNGGNGPYPVNNAMIQEIVVESAGAGADADASGLRTNLIPKQGGNTFSTYFFANFTHDKVQAENLDDDLRRRGAPTPSLLKENKDINPAFGGPLMRDKVWFYGSYRFTTNTEQPPGAFYDVDPYDHVFTPDLARGPAYAQDWTQSANLRMTWQVSQRSKVALYGDNHWRCIPCASALSSTTAWEATTHLKTPINRIMQATWNWTVTSRLLIDVGESYKPDAWYFTRQDGVGDDLSPIVDSGRGISFRAPANPSARETENWNGKANVTYVTGSHNLKVGAQWFHGRSTRPFENPNQSAYTFNNGVPVSVTAMATPFKARENLKINLGLFVQEQWTHRRLTLNLGVRYDHLNLYIPEQHLAPVRYVGARDFGKIEDVPNWHDISPRMGAAYDLFGNGKTALKWNLGRYMEAVASVFPEQVNPITQNANATRAWGDANGNFIPDCDLSNQLANGECQQSNNLNFGRPIVFFRYDPRASTGWGARANNWETMVGIQQELRPGLSVDVAYFSRWFSTFRVTQNTLVTPGDFDPYCITSPVDARLPFSGQQICGFYDLRVSPTIQFGASNNVITRTSNFGDALKRFDGVDVSVNARFPGGVQASGGTATGRTKTDLCGIVRPDVTIPTASSQVENPYGNMQIPATTAFCRTTPPFQTNAKFAVIYPVPWQGLQASLTFQSYPGPEIQATYAAPASAVTGLERPLAGGARTVTVPLVPAGTMYGERLNQVDFRIAKDVRIGRARIQPQMDLYNLLNGNAVFVQSNTYGAAWQRPTRILLGRMLKFGALVEF